MCSWNVHIKIFVLNPFDRKPAPDVDIQGSQNAHQKKKKLEIKSLRYNLGLIMCFQYILNEIFVLIPFDQKTAPDVNTHKSKVPFKVWIAN